MAFRRKLSSRTIDVMPATKKSLSDGGGLRIHQEMPGSKRWRVHYQLGESRSAISLGPYPEIGLAEARELADQVRLLVRQGIDPVALRKSSGQIYDASGVTVEDVAREWSSTMSKGWSDEYRQSVEVRLECHVYPEFGGERLAAITAVKIANLVKGLVAQGKIETAKRVFSNLDHIFSYAVASGVLARNPCAEIRKKSLVPRAPRVHRPAVTTPTDLSSVLQRISMCGSTFPVMALIYLTILTFLRSKALRYAKWAEIDFEKRCWLVPSSRMKTVLAKKLNGQPFLVPLSSQAIEILESLQVLTGSTGYLFPGQAGNLVIDANTLNKALRSVGISTKKEQSGHGFRATARTMLVEQLGYRRELAELQIDHTVKGPNGRAYDRTEFAPARAQMMQMWADYIDHLGGQKQPSPELASRLEKMRSLRESEAAWATAVQSHFEPTLPTTASFRIPGSMPWPLNGSPR